ncbi:MAG: hypothetical protein ACE3JP_08605 [Ectobacillus sp.]
MGLELQNALSCLGLDGVLNRTGSGDRRL